MKKVRAIALIALAVLTTSSLAAAAVSQHHSYLPMVATLAGDLALLNPGFEGAFREVDGITELKVASGWEPWWDPKATRPEYKRADLVVDPRRVHSGSAAQQWFNNYATHTAGIYQRVIGVPVGKTLVFETWVQAFSSGQDDFTHSNGRYRMRIGIDPYGGLDPESPDVVWSNGGNAVEPYDAYQLLHVEALARSDRATVFVWGQAEWPLKHNDAYCDDTRLYVLDDGSTPSPSPSPVPGGLTEEQVRDIVRQELAKAIRAWLATLE